MLKILVVDDEKEIADLVEVYLTGDGFEVHKYYSSKEAYEILDKEEFDLALLDLMMPEIDGYSLCAKIRAKYYYPVILLTAKNEDVDKIKGFTIGADDYITKPFSPLELLARVKAQIRRYRRYNKFEENRDIIDFNGLIINKNSHDCILNDRPLLLTPYEFDILCLLCENRGKVLSAEEIYENVWKEKSFNSNNTIMVHIRHLREKMGDTKPEKKYIKNVWGVGYLID